MITILGVRVPVNEKRLTPPQTEVILAYTNAIKEGKAAAKKILKIK